MGATVSVISATFLANHPLISPSAFFAEVAEAQTQGVEIEEAARAEDPEQMEMFTAPATEVPAQDAPADTEAPRPRSRVGSMFEQLSFGDVD